MSFIESQLVLGDVTALVVFYNEIAQTCVSRLKLFPAQVCQKVFLCKESEVSEMSWHKSLWCSSLGQEVCENRANSLYISCPSLFRFHFLPGWMKRLDESIFFIPTDQTESAMKSWRGENRGLERKVKIESG